jgi:small subunit ribosomal protein S2
MQEAERSGMYYVNSRWLGGTLTNFTTIRSRIERMNKLNSMEQMGDFELLPKKEVIKLKNERNKLQANLLGIKDMTTLPGLIIMVDPKSEHICVKEARRLGIPVVGIVDTNCDPDDVDVCIPANDDAIRSVKLILNALADAIIEGRDGVTLRDMNASDEEVSMDAVVKSTVTNKIADEKEQPAEEVVEENK